MVRSILFLLSLMSALFAFLQTDAVFAATSSTANKPVTNMPIRGVAPAAKPANATASGMVFSTGAEVAASDSEAMSEEEIQKERQKTMDDVNAFLIDSYKIKLDKILEDVYESVRATAKDDPKIQIAILTRIVEEIDLKLASIEERTISVNRKKILTAVFGYLKSNVQTKITSLSHPKE